MRRYNILRLAKLGTFLLLMLLWASTAPTNARIEPDDGIVRVKSAVPMTEAITRIKADIASEGIIFFMEIDQSKLAADAGIQLRPSTSVIFIGGGVISLEFGHVYARAGAGVTILEASPQLLPAIDADAMARLAAESERIGIRVKTGVSVKRIEPTNRRLRVIFMHVGTEHAAEADRVVNGAGRIANVDTLGLASGNVDHANGRVSVDRYLRSASNPLVHVCGDALPISPQLSPLATYEGEIVGRNIVEGPKHSPDYEGMATPV